jgi:hypothetical protein
MRWSPRTAFITACRDRKLLFATAICALLALDGLGQYSTVTGWQLAAGADRYDVLGLPWTFTLLWSVPLAAALLLAVGVARLAGLNSSWLRLWPALAAIWALALMIALATRPDGRKRPARADLGRPRNVAGPDAAVWRVGRRRQVANAPHPSGAQ